MTKTTDNVGMANAIESNRFVLKILDQRAFQFRILIALQQNVERLDDNAAKLLVRSAAIARDINLRVTSATETFFNIVTSIQPAL